MGQPTIINKKIYTMSQFSAFRLTPEQAQERARLIDNFCSAFYPVICSVYNAASAAITDCLPELRASPFFRHEVKQGVNAALAAYDALERRLRVNLGDRWQLWLDVSDEVYEEFRPVIARMFYTCSRYLRYKRAPDYAFKARLQVAVTLCEVAELSFSQLMERAHDSAGINLAPLFQGGTFRDVSAAFQKAVRPVINSGTASVIDLNKSTSFVKAVNEFITAASDGPLYNRAAERALRVNPSVWHFLSEVDQNALRTGQPLQR